MKTITINTMKHAKTLANSPKTDAPERAGLDGTRLVIMNMEGTKPINLNKYGGHPAPAGRALPNLLMRSKC